MNRCIWLGKMKKLNQESANILKECFYSKNLLWKKLIYSILVNPLHFTIFPVFYEQNCINHLYLLVSIFCCINVKNVKDEHMLRIYENKKFSLIFFFSLIHFSFQIKPVTKVVKFCPCIDWKWGKKNLSR